MSVMAGALRSDVVELSRAERPWKPRHRRDAEDEGTEPEARQTEELLGRVRSALNKLTPEMFLRVMKKLRQIPIRSDLHLRPVVEMVTERAIAEPKFSKVYADLCCCMKGLKVPMAEKRGITLNFKKLLLNRCKMEFERAVEQVEEKQIEDRQRHLEEGLEKTCVEVQQRSLGIVKFIGELFKLKLVSEGIIHDCIVRLLKKSKSLRLKSTSTGHFNPLWSLCVLLCTTGKDLERAKARMDQYFNQMKKMIQERKTSNRIRFMLQDVVDLRESNWIPRHSDPGPQTIKQIRKQTMEENLDRPLPFKKTAKGKNEPLPSCQATQQDQPGTHSITVLEGEDDCAGPDAKPSNSVEKGSASIQKQYLPCKVPQKFTAFSRGGKNEDTELFWSVHCILDELTPQTFEPLMRQVSRMPINSEVRLKGLIDLVYERALSVPKLSANYAQMCRCFAGVKVPKDDNWRETLNFRKLLLNRCQKEFEDDETEKQNEMGNDYEEEARATALRRSLGNVKFIGELFKIKMLTEPIIHDCIIKLFNSSQEECLCVLLLTVGKEIDFEEAKPRMEQYFDQMKKIIQEKKTSVNTQCMLQGVVDLRERHWVPKHTDLSLDNIIDQICQEKKKSATDSPQSMPDMELPADREERHENTEELHTITEELPTNTEADAEEEELQENTEALPKNTEALPKNTEALPKNIEALQENPEELQENTDQLHKNTERLPKNGEGLPKIREDNTQKLPKNTEELPKNAEDDKEELPKNTEEGDTDKLPKNTWAGNG
ncbi:uncharacterized protein LOC143124025 isoform X4 [Alosa pseudoharengus]|uniref:uncharacterized protein LOC143124025 isoform X4 n=1 Tax=Alosa pseudoharengus TaxID=34774 RepID=UPI003F8A529A